MVAGVNGALFQTVLLNVGVDKWRGLEPVTTRQQVTVGHIVLEMVLTERPVTKINACLQVMFNKNGLDLKLRQIISLKKNLITYVSDLVLEFGPNLIRQLVLMKN